ncbi:DUF6586 family protein [Azomonas macrocytogenes]|uniref:PasA protein n=1 Tax=Azomonas macrocytogenes TaxID=69962 RepID=A0A839SWI4_AZOMA|nr:DUF6586 family protein [Azomonas macrocytogenes]MBB3101751.1 hypothetical protein [Azomonas macrocytogenes]
MAHEFYTRTNQKIYFAGLSLENWRKAATGGLVGDMGKIQAEREASLFHLYGALLGLCHEILGFYRSPAISAKRVEKILTRSTLETTPCPELSELLELSRNPTTWLANLLTQHAQLYQPPHASREPKSNPDMEIIEAVNLAEEALVILNEYEEMESWRKQLKELTLRFRESMTEW